MTAYYEEPEFLQTKAFLALCDCIDRLTRKKGVAVPDAMSAGRKDAEAGALRAASGLAFSKDALKAVIKTPSYPVFRALFDGENAQAWRDGLRAQLEESSEDGGGFHSSQLPIFTAEAAQLRALAEFGVIKADNLSLSLRILMDDSPEFDELLALLYPAAKAPLVELMKSHDNPLSLMRPGAGGAHIHTLATHVRLQHKTVIEELSSQSKMIVETYDWRELALMMRLGIDASSLAGDMKEGSAMRALFEASGSAHGRVTLLAQEPDLEDMIARRADGTFFGLTREDLKEANRG